MNKLLYGSLIFFGIFIAFFGVAVLFFFLRKRQKKKLEEIKKCCSVKVKATVIKMERCLMMRSDPYSYMWVPTYQYYVDGDQTKPLETKGHIGNGKKIFAEGHELDLYYNPEQPEEIYVPEEGADYLVKLFLIMCIGFGVSSVLALIIYWFVCKDFF